MHVKNPAPHYILTNRHVVEDATKIYIKDPTRSHQGFRATIVAKHPGFDLAILRCESLQAPPVKLAASLPGRGTDIMVLGYPQFDQIGMGLKSTRGAIVSTPSSDIDNMMLVDAQINSGNSGGPIVDQTGKVVAVATAVIKTRGGTGGRYGAGLPIPLAKSFLEKNVRDLTSKKGRNNPQNQKLEWPEVDAQVSRSTVLIFVDIAAPRSPAGRDSDDESPFAIEDKSCPACNGTAQVKKGFTRVRCPHCRGGLDPSLIRMVPVYVPRRRP
jgi:S1-C subfamily serine protease